MARPECFEFAMDFLGGQEGKIVREYVEQLEQALQNVLDCIETGDIPISHLDNIKRLLEPSERPFRLNKSTLTKGD